MTAILAHAPVELFTLSEGAQRLRVCVATLRAWCLSGKVPYVRAGRKILLTSADLDGFLISNRVAK
jgi:excisionase family DNA binding protein